MVVIVSVSCAQEKKVNQTSPLFKVFYLSSVNLELSEVIRDYVLSFIIFSLLFSRDHGLTFL